MKHPSRFRVACMAAGAVAIMAGSMAQARDLTIALRSEPTSMDPQFHALTSNIQLSHTLFDKLATADENINPVPQLAESWEVDENVWTFKLRPDVKFSNGQPLTAEDVIFTFNRVPNVPNSPSSFQLFLAGIQQVEALDPLTLRITTDGANPILPINLSQIPILSHEAAAGPATEGKTTTELNRGDGLIGTGPYKFVSWQRGADLVFERNENYWGPEPAWDKVTYRMISNPAARVASLLAGDVDVIEGPSTDDIPRLEKDSNLRVIQTPSVRLIYIHINQSDDLPPGLKSPDGKNPLKDARVRKALSLAIDRQAIVARIMGGVAQAAGDLLPYPSFGTSEARSEAPKADLEKAKELLAEAGYGDGFELSLGSPAGRYTNDQEIAQAVASMWSRIGLKVDVQTMAPSVFFQRRGEYAFSTYLAGWAAASGETSNPLNALLATRDKDKSTGTTNYSHYSNPEMDALVAEAEQTLDDNKRSKLLIQAADIALNQDQALLPLQYEMTVWAMKKDIDYTGRADQMTLAQDFKPAK